jgi:hypothetical protein
MSEMIGSVLQSRKRQPLSEMINESTDHYEQKLKHLLQRKQADRENPLEHHCINPSLRARMTDWMIEVVTSFGLKHRTYFLAVNLMDIFLKTTQKEFTSNELHIIGVTCMIVSSKFNDSNHLTINSAERFIGNGEFRRENLVLMEREIFGLINHHVGMVTVYDLLKVLCDKYQVIGNVKRTAITILYLLQMYYDAIGMSISTQAFSAFLVSLHSFGQHQVLEAIKVQGDCKVEAKSLELVASSVFRFKSCFPCFSNPNRFLNFDFTSAGSTELFVLRPSTRFKC